MNSALIPTDAPTASEVEVSLFGPGFGECIVCHLGYSQWIVIDSCVNQQTGNPIAIDYLSGLGVDVAKDVKLVVATHWHDDHVQGIATLFSAASSAKFAMSAALQKKEFLAMLEASSKINLVRAESGTSELKAVFEEIKRTKTLRRMTGPDIWAQSGMLLFEYGAGENSIQLRALSPSAHVVTSAVGRLSEMMPNAGETFRRFHQNHPNDTSVVIQARIRGQTLLFGGDLLVGGNDHSGWRGVMLSDFHGGLESQCFKISHHGSENACFPKVWEKLVDDDGVAILTRFTKGRKPLPSPEDIARLLEKQPDVYITTARRRRPKRRRRLEKTISGVLSNRSTLARIPGQVRVRIDASKANAVPAIELFNGASNLRVVAEQEKDSGGLCRKV